MIKLNTLVNNPGSKKNRKRVGRGIGSGTGKTCGRGGKGQTARSGVAINGFEGGQMPLIKRLPKRGFKSNRSVNYQLINIWNIEYLIAHNKIDGTHTITKEILFNAGVIRDALSPIKLLAKGDGLKQRILIQVDSCSMAAKKIVEEAGGEVHIISNVSSNDEILK